MIVESGAVSLAAETTLLALFALQSPATLSAFDVIAQVAVCLLAIPWPATSESPRLTGIDVILDRRAGWANRSTSYFAR